MSRSKTHPTLNVERFGAGVYMVKAYGTDRVWTVTSKARTSHQWHGERGGPTRAQGVVPRPRR
jgi:hypothetical protein